LTPVQSSAPDQGSVAARLLALEARLGLLERTVGGVRFWEHLRMQTFWDLSEASGETSQPHTVAQRSPAALASLALRAVRNSVARNPLLAGPREFLFYGHPRRKLEEDGAWWDLYCDPLTALLEGRYVHLEGYHLLGHATPPKTQDLRYMDLVKALAAAKMAISERRPVGTPEEHRMLEEVERQVNAAFGTALPIKRKALHVLAVRRATLPLYRRILRRVRPRLVVLVVSYGKTTFIEACRLEGIPVAELQHGIIHGEHLGYQFPDAPKRAFPDYLLTYGAFWNQAAAYPLPPERVLAVGYPYFTMQSRKHPPSPRPHRLLFLSQGTIGAALSRLAVEVAARAPAGITVTYKLHPGEAGRWRAEYPWLAGAPVEVIEGPEPSLYGLFAESVAQVGVNSTALFEGLGYRLPTYFLEAPGIDAMAPLLQQGHATLVHTAGDLLAALSSSRPPAADMEAFFKPATAEDVVLVLERLARAGTTR
jgi:hypothetical protein